MNKNPNSTGKRNSLPQLRGVDARKWRHQLASSSTRPGDTVRTLKFKLDFPAGTNVNFDHVRTLNRVVDGVGLGSLTGLLLTAHCSGFRLFMQEAGAIQFRQQAGGTSAGFSNLFAAATGMQVNGLDPPGLQARFTKRPRSRAGKDIRFIPEIIAAEYTRHFTGKKVLDADPKVVDLFTDWAELLHQEFKDEPDGWTAIQADPIRAAHTFDQLASIKGWNLPTVVIPPSQLGGDIWKSCVLAFDPKQPQLDSTSDVTLHSIVALRLRQLRSSGTEFTQKARAPLQESITSQTSAGLSWLFGSGLNLLRNAASSTEVARGLGVPIGSEALVEPLLSAARAVSTDPLFCATGYADYRRLVGGRLDSWLANYLSRLLQLDALLQVPATELKLSNELVEAWERWFGRLPLTAVQVQTMLDTAFKRRAAAQEALDVLTGASDIAVTSDHVAAVELYSQIASEAVGALNSLRKILAPEDNDGAQPQPGMPSVDLLKAPAWLDDLPKLNSFTGAIPDFEAELLDTAAAMVRLEAECAGLMKASQTWESMPPAGTDELCFHQLCLQYARLNFPGVLTSSTADAPWPVRIKEYDERYTDQQARQAEENVLRTFLHRFGRAALGCSLPVREAVRDFYKEIGVFADPKNANRFFINQQGAIYRSPYSRSRHEDFALGHLLDHPYLAGVLGRIRAFCENAAASVAGILPTDVLRLRHSVDSIMISGLSRSLPGTIFQQIYLDEHFVRIPSSMKLMMQAQEWDPALIAKFYNLVLSARIAMLTLLNRKKFFVRARFQRVGDTALTYRPKDKAWHVPPRLLTTTGPIGDALRLMPELNAIDGGVIHAPDCVQRVITDPQQSAASISAYLRQAPHDWYYHPGFSGTENTSGWLTVDGKDGISKKLAKKSLGGRLIGTPSYKSELDKLLLAEGRTTFGDVTLIFDQEYDQTVVLSSDGTSSPKLVPGKITTSIAIPLTIDAATKTAFPYPDHVVAIDQGEAGIGFAVLDVRTRTVIASGGRRIPSIRRLINKAKQYRISGQRPQKFQQRFDTTMFVMRENVVGDVCHVICELMHAYKAFPVVESQVGNLEGGSRQLDLVYKAVTTRFTYSDIPAHGTERKSYWMGGDRWEHPYLLSEAWEDGKKSGKKKPLSLFPGAKGPTAGTSQQCSHCKRNPIRELRDIEETGRKTVDIKWGGIVELKTGRIALLTASDVSADHQAARRRNERLPPSRPVPEGTLKTTDAIAVARRCLRQAPRSRQSNDTTQSTYQCLYVDCGIRMHADENAARNIGRRFLEEKVSE